MQNQRYNPYSLRTIHKVWCVAFYLQSIGCGEEYSHAEAAKYI